jgi:hypothetical protein
MPEVGVCIRADLAKKRVDLMQKRAFNTYKKERF